MKHYRTTNIKITQKFNFKHIFTAAELYLDIRNVFNRKNVIWMDSSGRIGGELGDPAGYSIGRRTHLGLRLTI